MAGKMSVLRISVRDQLILLNVLVAALAIAIAFFPSSIVRAVLGSILSLFLPGHVVLAAILPRKAAMRSFERAAFSCIVSIALLSLDGLILVLLPWGITIESILYTLSFLVLGVSVAAWLRSRRLPEPERLGVEVRMGWPRWTGSTLDRTISVILAVLILGVAALAGYVAAHPETSQGFTDFYVLGADGRTASYPERVVVGSEVNVTVGIINREHEPAVYRVVVLIGDAQASGTAPIALAHDKRWEQLVAFTPQVVGERKAVEFLLFKDGDTEPYLRPLRLWISVVD